MKGFNHVLAYVEGKGFVKTSIFVSGDKITKISEEDNKDGLEIKDDLMVIPGLIDSHIHASHKQDTMYATPEAIKTIAETIASEGVTTFLPTTMTCPKDEIDKALENVAQWIKEDHKEGARVAGIHLEGPYISEKHKGAQLASNIRKPDVKDFESFQAHAHGAIKKVTIACEEDQDLALTKYLYQNKIVASIGHTDATAEQTLAAAEAGVTCATHTYNAMRGLHHREAGTVGGVFLSDNVYGELICDLIHISGPAIRVMARCKGLDKIILITDAMEAKHMPDGQYQLGGQDVFVKNGAARLADGTLAGSTLYLNNAVKNFRATLNIPLEKAVDCATKNPALNLGLYDSIGSIKEGKKADFAVVDKDMKVYLTVRDGNIIYEAK